MCSMIFAYFNHENETASSSKLHRFSETIIKPNPNKQLFFFIHTDFGFQIIKEVDMYSCSETDTEQKYKLMAGPQPSWVLVLKKLDKSGYEFLDPRKEVYVIHKLIQNINKNYLFYKDYDSLYNESS